MSHFLRSYFAVPASAVLLALCFPGFHWWALAWVALAPVVWRAARAARPLEAAGWFLLAGHLFHSVLLQWLFTNIMWAGGWALIGQQLLCLALALFWGALGFTWAWARARAPRVAGAWLLAALWAVMEYAQATLFTGFGWSALGYSQGGDLLFAQWAAVGGVGLLGFLLVWVNGLLALAVAEPARRWPRVAAAVLIVALAHVGGFFLLEMPNSGPPLLRAGVMQGNFPIEMKYDGEYTIEMARKSAQHSVALAEVAKIDLMVWPEATLMDDFSRPEMMEWLREFTIRSGAWLFAGSVREDLEGRSFNSSVLVDPTGAVRDHYDKVHLAPFGEYLPFDQYFPFLKHVVPSNADFGDGHRVLTVANHRIGPMICFEVLFSPIAETLRAEGAEALAVITNLAWFGRSSAIPQELEIGRIRAIETRLSLIHAANTGVSGVFDPYGRFTIVSGRVMRDGGYYALDPARLNPRNVVMYRLVGDFDVAPPARRPLGAAPGYFPMCAVLLAAVGLALCWRRGAVATA